MSAFPQSVTRRKFPQSGGFLISSPTQAFYPNSPLQRRDCSPIGDPIRNPGTTGRGVRLRAPALRPASVSPRCVSVSASLKLPGGRGTRWAPRNLTPNGAPGPQPTCRTRAALGPGCRLPGARARQPERTKTLRRGNAPSPSPPRKLAAGNPAPWRLGPPESGPLAVPARAEGRGPGVCSSRAPWPRSAFQP